MDNTYSSNTRRMGFTQLESAGPIGESKLFSVPWGVWDVVAAALFVIAAIISALGVFQVVEMLSEDDSAGRAAAGAIAVGLSVAMVLGIAKASRIRILPAFLCLAGLMVLSGLLSVASSGGFDDSGSRIAGLPVAIVMLSLVEGVFFVTAWLYTCVKHGTPFASLGFVRTYRLRSYLTALLWWLAAAAGIGVWALTVKALGINFFLPGDSAEEALGLAGGSVIIAVALVGILGPIAEEVFFRGFVLNGLRSRFGTVPAVIVSSAIFGMFHVAPSLMVVTFILGIAFAVIYVRTGSLWPAIFAHCFQNTMAIIAASSN